ncbi:DsbA family protein [Shewanella yunxiaonensis]|uniref:DsbA family protein n=1 Tax=Shewanella yunxiaonensis TaxID=2829809 RepID=A0ABX7YV82_9GAMM|nr:MULTISPECIES: DsbA family protein [Shewanella]MDF0533207.1 DsbA family protein [Shewanella sp. A32]QUN06550.1 DsbA family protein [Shewanella yunxiaonensis]
MLKPILAAVVISVASLSAQAADFIEGKHYTQVADKGSATPKVSEFFSFYCPHCYHMSQKYLPFIKANLKPGVTFESKHVDFMNSALGTEVMKSLAVMEQLGLESQLLPEMFKAIQGPTPGEQFKSTVNSRDDIKAVFAKAGVDAAKYDATADSSAVNDTIKLWRQQQNDFRIDSVPTFIVNDKYMINLSEMHSIKDLVDIINYLATEKDKEKSGGSVGWLFLAFAGLAAITRRRV